MKHASHVLSIGSAYTNAYCLPSCSVHQLLVGSPPSPHALPKTTGDDYEFEVPEEQIMGRNGVYYNGEQNRWVADDVSYETCIDDNQSAAKKPLPPVPNDRRPSAENVGRFNRSQSVDLPCSGTLNRMVENNCDRPVLKPKPGTNIFFFFFFKPRHVSKE
jgi:hypothetical protein